MRHPVEGGKAGCSEVNQFHQDQIGNANSNDYKKRSLQAQEKAQPGPESRQQGPGKQGDQNAVAPTGRGFPLAGTYILNKKIRCAHS